MKINNKNKIVKNNSLSFIYSGIKKQSLSFLIIILFINILLPFNVVFTHLGGVSLEKNIVTAETTLEAAQKKLEEAKANLNKINLIIKDYQDKIAEAKSKNQDTTQLEKDLTVINRDVWAAANSEVIAAQKEVTKEEILAAAADEAVTFTPQTEDTSSDSKVYTLLAPIGEFKTAPEDIGSYFNTIFNIALGLCAVLAVIMIVIGGVQYMGDESIFGKTEAKDRITKAIFGLLIALGSYALLNTINPDLLGGRGVTIKAVSVVIDPEVHGDTPQSAISGKYCNGKYTSGDVWASDKKERDAVITAGITVNSPNCTKVGQSGCTSLAGLNTSSVIALKKSTCPSCDIVITGGTECWLHSNKTLHLPGNSFVDLRLTTSLVKYVDESKTKIKSTGMNFPVFLKGTTQFMREPNHYHIIKW
ncbi:MAG: hypothetical protein JJE53_00265 [Candidatus Pacebacteria bacterium]|nr:hypothetical protein [Candidatus Paceibacterota bacterium]